MRCKALVFLLFVIPALSYGHREHGAHEHGHGDLSVAFDGAKGVIEFKAPSESIYGFEHVPKTDKQKKQVSEAFAKLENKISEMVAFDASLKCAFTKDSVETRREDEKSPHSEVGAKFNVICEKSPVGTAVVFNLVKAFPRLTHVEVTVLADAVQKGAELKKRPVTLELKP